MVNVKKINEWSAKIMIMSVWYEMKITCMSQWGVNLSTAFFGSNASTIDSIISTTHLLFMIYTALFNNQIIDHSDYSKNKPNFYIKTWLFTSEEIRPLTNQGNRYDRFRNAWSFDSYSSWVKHAGTASILYRVAKIKTMFDVRGQEVGW